MDFIILTAGEECEESTNRDVFSDKSESFVVVFLLVLSKAFSVKSSFIEIINIFNI